MNSTVRATVFWVGEDATPDNDFIPNSASAWDGNWAQHYGGVDDPGKRQHGGLWPAAFTPKENPFYFALPYSEFTDGGVVKSNVTQIPWYNSQAPPVSGKISILKNHWIAVRHSGQVAYAQWEDVGPFESDDGRYVFGGSRPKSERAGLDLSPATAAYLGINGSGLVNWTFVDEKAVPEGPWREIVTTRQASY
jgi:hypothetical protein